MLEAGACVGLGLSEQPILAQSEHRLGLTGGSYASRHPRVPVFTHPALAGLWPRRHLLGQHIEQLVDGHRPAVTQVEHVVGRVLVQSRELRRERGEDVLPGVVWRA